MIKAYAKSDVGKVREIKTLSGGESFMAALSLALGMADQIKSKKGSINLDMMFIDEGFGSLDEHSRNQAVRVLQENNFAQADKDKESIIQLVASSLEYANMVVYEKSKENKELNGMGTTLDICLIYNNKAYIGHVGDSRIYRIRKDFIRKLTQDHSYVQKLVKDGKITEEEAAHHPQKNMLMKALRM